LLSGQIPFKSRSRSKTVDLILEGSVNYDAPIWADDIAKDFVGNLLVVNPNNRMTAAAASNHAWIVNREVLPEEEPDMYIMKKVGHSLQQYVLVSDLKKISLKIIAHKATGSQVYELRKVFAKLDERREGILTYNDFRQLLKRIFNFSDEDVEAIISSLVSCCVCERPATCYNRN
jgi:serine/threonine protein kinase